MASKKALKNARELLDLDVKEVSLVDRPANLREFLIVKRDLASNLGIFEADLEKMAEAPGAPTESIHAVLNYLTKSNGGDLVDKTETVEMLKARHAYEVETQKAGKVDETPEQLAERHKAELAAVEKAAPAATEGEPAAEPPPAEPAAPTEPAKVEKSEPAAEPPPAEPAAPAEPDLDDQPMVVIKRDGSVHVAGQTVQKAKTFGKAKTATLQNAVGALAKLLGDVSEDALKSAMAPYMDPTKKVDTAKAVEPTPTPTADPTELVTKALTDALEPITKRLEAIEKTRNPSQSVEPDGGTDTQGVQKTDSIWAGVL